VCLVVVVDYLSPESEIDAEFALLPCSCFTSNKETGGVDDF
jgi:hypothetical protein